MFYYVNLNAEVEKKLSRTKGTMALEKSCLISGGIKFLEKIIYKHFGLVERSVDLETD